MPCCTTIFKRALIDSRKQSFSNKVLLQISQSLCTNSFEVSLDLPLMCPNPGSNFHLAVLSHIQPLIQQISIKHASPCRSVTFNGSVSSRVQAARMLQRIR